MHYLQSAPKHNNTSLLVLSALTVLEKALEKNFKDNCTLFRCGLQVTWTRVRIFETQSSHV